MNDILHIYGQGAWHDDVEISGTRESLEKLRAAIVKVLDDGCVSSYFTSFVNDGEGFGVRVSIKTPEEMLKEDEPYYEDYARRIKNDDEVGGGHNS